MMSLARELMFDLSPKATAKGSVFGFFVVAAFELQKWFSREKNQRDVTVLLANLTGIAINIFISTLYDAVFTCLIIVGGAVGLVIAVVLVVVLLIGIFLDKFDELIGGTKSIIKFYNEVKSSIQNTLQIMVDFGNINFNLKYTIPSFLL